MKKFHTSILMAFAGILSGACLSVSAMADTQVRFYESVKPEVAEGEYAVNVNGRWVDCGEEEAYAVSVDDKNVFYVPLKAVADELGAVIDGSTLTYKTAEADLTGYLFNASGEEAEDGEYVPLTFFADGFNAESYEPGSEAYKVIGGKTMTDGPYLYITLTDDETVYVLDVDGNEIPFTAGRYQNEEGFTVPYRAAMINGSKEEAAPLIVFLHGNSYRGYDGIAPLKLTPATTIAKYLLDNDMKGYILIPQCTNTTREGWTVLTDDIANVITAYMEENDIDPGRVYITGCSMGSHGTWGMLRDHADLFAAGMPISGNANSPMCNIALEEITTEVPLYMLVGGGDSQEMQDGMQAFYEGFKAAGGTVVYETEPSYNHMQSCEYSMTAPRLDWLLGFVKTEDGKRVRAYRSEKPEIAEDAYAINANGAWVTFGEALPYAEEEVVYVPLKEVSNALGVTYNNAEEGKYIVAYNDIEADASEAVVLKDDVAYVPVTFWEEAFYEDGAKAFKDGNFYYLSMKADYDYLVAGNEQDYIFEPHTYEGDMVLNYRTTDVLPEQEGKNALVLFLHGSSYRGTDNATYLKLNGTYDIPDYLVRNGIKAKFIMGQFKNPNWVAYSSTLGDMLKSYVDDASYDIDPNRVYVMGVSMGGQGTWAVTSDHPDFFAAAMPVAFAAVTDPEVSFENLVTTPLMIVAGENDHLAGEDGVTSPTRIQGSYETIIADGGEAVFDIMPGLDHIAVCEAAFTTEHLDWVFSHVKGE